MGTCVTFWLISMLTWPLLTGIMAAGANCPLVVRFCPRALGQHQASLSVQVLSETSSRVVAAVPFQALGLCMQLGALKHPLPGGSMAVPESFAKPKQFVDTDKASWVTEHIQQHMQCHPCNEPQHELCPLLAI